MLNVFGVRGGLELTLDGGVGTWKFQEKKGKRESTKYGLDTSKIFTLPTGSRYLYFDCKIEEITSYCKCSSSIDQNPCHHRR